MISIINRRVKHLEKHLDIKIVYQGEEVNTLFERFSAFSFDCADLTLYSSEKSKRIKLHYDFNTGNLTDLKNGLDIEVLDLFSSRHLRSQKKLCLVLLSCSTKNILIRYSVHRLVPRRSGF